MEIVPVGVPLSFEVTYDRDDLNVGMTVYDDSGNEPVLLLSPFEMILVYGFTYRAKFTAEAGKSYIITKAVYTNSDFDEIDENYSQGSESCIAEYLNTTPPCSVVGIVDDTVEIVGLVEC